MKSKAYLDGFVRYLDGESDTNWTENSPNPGKEIMGHKSKKCCNSKSSCTTSGSCDNGLGIGALQALARNAKRGDCWTRLCVATTPGGGDDELFVRRFPTGAIPGNDIIMTLPRLYSVYWNRCDPGSVAKPFCQRWLRVCVDGYMATRFLEPSGDGNFRVNTTTGISVNFRSQATTSSSVLGGIPDSFIVQGLGDPLIESDGFSFRHIRVCGWSFAGYLADCKCVEGLNGNTFSSVPTGGSNTSFNVQQIPDLSDLYGEFTYVIPGPIFQ